MQLVANLYATAAIMILIYMTGLFVLALHLRNNSIADIGWGSGFIIATWTAWLQSDRSLIPTLALILVVLWGARLSWHNLRRNAGKPEDWRYAQWRKDWGKWFVLRSYLQVFVLQGALLFVIVSAVIWAQSTQILLPNLLTYIGLLIWCIGYGFEVLADYQLAQYLQGPRAKDGVCNIGLWRYSRHPNYFGESLVWWGLFVIALSVGAPWWLIVSPITITVLVRFVSGVPLLEQKMMQRATYRAYAKQTNVFFPLPPKH